MTTITTDYLGDMRFRTRLGDHTLDIDVPPGMGGRNRAPTPPELFIASLGSCVAAFVAGYCERVGLDDQGLAVDVRFDKVDDPTRLVDLAVTVRLPNAVCGRREEALRRVAEHCPVHATISTLETVAIEILDQDALEHDRRHELGPGGSCVCPRCETRIPHVRGVRCEEERCPSCANRMLREGSRHHQLWLAKHGPAPVRGS